MSQPLSLKDQLARLVQLQELDLKIDSLNKQKGGLPQAMLGMDRELATLNQRMGAQTAALEELQKKERQARAAIDLNRERETRANEKLGTASNSHEFQAATKELDQLKKQSVVLADQLKAQQAEVQTASAALEAVRSRISELQEKRQAEEQKISGESSTLEGQSRLLMAERTQFTAQIERRVLSLYDRVRAGRAGVGIAPATAGRCGVCNMMVPPQMYNELQKGKELHSCPSCNRILYVPGQAGA